MSFILDQLKKSGRQRALEMAMRKQTETSGPKTDQPLFVRSGDRTPVRIQKWHVTAGAVLLGAVAVYVVAAYFWRPFLMRQPVVPAVKELTQKASQLPAIPPSSGPSVQIPQAHLQTEIVPNAKSPAAAQKQTGAAKAVNHVAALDRGRNFPEQTGPDRSTEVRGKRAPGALIDAPVGVESFGSVLEFKQLPQAVRKSLPEIRITSHLYRKDSRLVSINGRIMSEGYNMDDGLFLEEITPEGVILSYGKHRFLVRAER
jgi:hypothetical protein